MKKNIIIAAVIIAALAFGVASCKKEDKAKCWAITVSGTFEEAPDTTTIHIWCTEAECDSRIAEVKEEAKNQGVTDFKVEKAEASKYTTEADCYAQNDSENKGEAIWGWVWNWIDPNEACR